MEKIKLNDGTTFDIVSGSYEYVNILAPSIDEVISCFTDENLRYCEILADVTKEENGEIIVTDEEIIRAVFINKQMKDFRASRVDNMYDIVITFGEYDTIAGRLAALEETVDALVLESLGL